MEEKEAAVRMETILVPAMIRMLRYRMRVAKGLMAEGTQMVDMMAAILAKVSDSGWPLTSGKMEEMRADSSVVRFGLVSSHLL